MKKIRITVEWDGACSEFDWGDVPRDAIEQFDVSGVTRVSEVEVITHFGTTEVLTLAIDSDPSAIALRKHNADSLRGSSQ